VGVTRTGRNGGGSSRYLITGGAGFVGSHLAESLVSRGDEVVLLDDLSTGRRENVEHLLEEGQAELIEGSVLDAGLVNELMLVSSTCFHLASPVGVKLVVDKPLETTIRNVRGIDIVTEAVARHGTRLVFASTSEVYGKQSGSALREDADRVYGSMKRSRWGYATAKALGEMLIFGYHSEYETKASVLRLFNTVGPRQRASYGMVVPRFIEQALAGEDLTVNDDGEQSRCFTHVRDVVDAFLRVVECDGAIGNVYNVGSRVEVTINDLAARVIERTQSDSEIRHVSYDAAYGEGFEELGRRRPDTSAFQELTGWHPQCDLDDAIDDIVASRVESFRRMV
jgi:UDP-glucose 4-epimerase